MKGKELMSNCQLTNIRVSGKSMLPSLQEDDIVKIEMSSRYRFGDIVCFIDHNKVYIHRIVLRMGKTYLLKGDNNKNFDGFYKDEDIVGRCKEERSKKIAAISFVRGVFSLS